MKVYHCNSVKDLDQLTLVLFPFFNTFYSFVIQIEETIIHDAVQHFKEALYVLSTKDVKIQPKPLFCNRKEKYHAGVDIATLLREVSILFYNSPYYKFEFIK